MCNFIVHTYFTNVVVGRGLEIHGLLNLAMNLSAK